MKGRSGAQSVVRFCLFVESTRVRRGLADGLFPSGFPTKILYAFLISPILSTLLLRLNPVAFLGLISDERGML